jgi:hypothetical protein
MLLQTIYMILYVVCCVIVQGHHLSLAQWLICDTLALLHLRSIARWCQRIARVRQCFNMLSMMLVRLERSVNDVWVLRRNRLLTNGTPQYVHQLICGLSRLMKILGWPSGPPPPSHETMRSCRQRTGCLWMRSIAASGRG